MALQGLSKVWPRLHHLALWHGRRYRHRSRHATPDVWARDQRRSATSGNASSCPTHHPTGWWLELRSAESASPRTPSVLAKSMLDTLEVEDRVPRNTTLQRIAQACRRDRHGACVAPTTHIARRPRQSFRWMRANWACGRCDTPTIDGMGRCVAHTHCLKPILSTVTRENGIPSCGQQWPTIAVHNCGSGSPATTKWSLSSKDSWISLVCGSYLPQVCCFAHSNDTETILLCTDGHYGTTPQ